MRNNTLSSWIQYCLFALACGCLVVAGTSFIFGENNLFQTSPFPLLVMVVAVLIWLYKSDRNVL